ncbi:MAG: hypothetical protein R3316_04465 [Rhodovibrionaceae bacterium]|nr:hypothetical protein [Rhodovibrionaceae bacterium]
MPPATSPNPMRRNLQISVITFAVALALGFGTLLGSSTPAAAHDTGYGKGGYGVLDYFLGYPKHYGSKHGHYHKKRHYKKHAYKKRHYKKYHYKRHKYGKYYHGKRHYRHGYYHHRPYRDHYRSRRYRYGDHYAYRHGYRHGSGHRSHGGYGGKNHSKQHYKYERHKRF